MSSPGEEAHIADCAIASVSASETELLGVGYTLDDEANCKHDDACDITASTEVRLRGLGHIWRVEDGDWKRASPNPKHLEDPEAQERPELVPLVVEPIVFSSLQDPEE